MKFIFAFLVFVVFEAIETHNLNVSIFYESLCKKSMVFFKTQLWPAYQNKAISRQIRVELVPFGIAEITTDPWTVVCHHGPRECFGNALQACFIAKNPDNYDQVAFASCCMSENDPPEYGELCSSIMGSDYEEIRDCTKSPEGMSFQLDLGERTQEYLSVFDSLPGVIYNNVFNKEDCKQSLKDFKKVVLRKISEQKKGKLEKSPFHGNK